VALTLRAIRGRGFEGSRNELPEKDTKRDRKKSCTERQLRPPRNDETGQMVLNVVVRNFFIAGRRVLTWGKSEQEYVFHCQRSESYEFGRQCLKNRRPYCLRIRRSGAMALPSGMRRNRSSKLYISFSNARRTKKFDSRIRNDLSF
jgi:hypothetical protein